MTTLSNTPNIDNYFADLIFFVRYTPKALLTLSKFSLLGAAVGLFSSYAFEGIMIRFAAENHDAVDISGNHVPDDEQFLRSSRASMFNKVTPPISEIIPIYATMVGVYAGGFFAVNKISKDFQQKLHEDREVRHLNIV